MSMLGSLPWGCCQRSLMPGTVPEGRTIALLLGFAIVPAVGLHHDVEDLGVRHVTANAVTSWALSGDDDFLAGVAVVHAHGFASIRAPRGGSFLIL
jgi:hypothetical protein